MWVAFLVSRKFAKDRSSCVVLLIPDLRILEAFNSSGMSSVFQYKNFAQDGFL